MEVRDVTDRPTRAIGDDVRDEASTVKHRYDGFARGRDDGLHTCVCGGVWSDSGCDLDESGPHVDRGVAWPCCLVEGCHRANRLREGIVQVADGLAHDDPLRAELKQLVTPRKEAR